MTTNQNQLTDAVPDVPVADATTSNSLEFTRSDLLELTSFALLISDQGVTVKLCVAYSRSLGFDASVLVATAISDFTETVGVNLRGEEPCVSNPERAYTAFDSLQLLTFAAKTTDSLTTRLTISEELLAKCRLRLTDELKTFAEHSVDRLLDSNDKS